MIDQLVRSFWGVHISGLRLATGFLDEELFYASKQNAS